MRCALTQVTDNNGFWTMDNVYPKSNCIYICSIFTLNYTGFLSGCINEWMLKYDPDYIEFDRMMRIKHTRWHAELIHSYVSVRVIVSFQSVYVESCLHNVMKWKYVTCQWTLLKANTFTRQITFILVFTRVNCCHCTSLTQSSLSSLKCREE